MHAKADRRLSFQWVIDRGGSMSCASKSYGYILNTTQEDQQVGRQISGWQPKEYVKLLDLSCFSAPARAWISALTRVLLRSCSDLGTPSWKFSDKVVEVLMATALLHYPNILFTRSGSPYIKRVQGAIRAAAILEAEVLAWAVSIRRVFDPRPNPADSMRQTSELVALMQQQTSQITQLFGQPYKERFRILEYGGVPTTLGDHRLGEIRSRPPQA